MANSDWLPRSREKQLAMAYNWLTLMKQKGKVFWKMEQETINDFEEAYTLASDEMKRPQTSRNAGTNVQLKEAFEKLTALMREVKRRYFLTPPLSHADIANLGLHLKDEVPTPISVPAGQASAEVSYPGSGQLMLRIKHTDDTPLDERADYGVKIYYAVLGTPNEKDKFRIPQPPETGEDLPHSVFTRQKKYRFDFSGDSGKQVFFCLRYENSKGQAGPWGKIFSAYVP